MYIPSWIIFQEMASSIGGILHTCVYSLATFVLHFFGLCVSICVIAIVVFFSAIYFFTTDSFWNSQKKKYYKSSIYVTAIAFGLLHLIAFSNYDYTLIPYMLCIISVPFFGGCAITYYRVNLGFWWGVGLHIFNNIPAIIVMLSI